MTFPWEFLAFIYLLLFVVFFGIGALLGLLLTYAVLRSGARAKATNSSGPEALGPCLLGALAGGTLNFVVVWLLTVV